MIWYLLYPLRGTTEPPDLAPEHPLRNAFAKYGRYVARHVVTAVLISVTVATILIYPIPYLFTRDFVNGASYVPYHVWTGARPITFDPAIEPDIIMKSIWIHSSYMGALNPDLLASALDLQNELLGDTENFSPRQELTKQKYSLVDGSLTAAQRDALHIANGLTPQSWFFHSPLIYWNYSRNRILTDPDVLSTINNRKNQSNFANTTLRHSVVFSGKRFEDRRLVAADAIVITLLYLKDSPMGREWDKNVLRIQKKVSETFDFYPSDGRSPASHLYEFQFRPMSAKDILSLGLAYGLALVYFMTSLSKLRAVKSKFGLIITIIAQIAFSIMSSFTICAIFNFDLSRIPQAAYPLVVLSMSLENTLRLINAVILTPLEDSTSNRIGSAFGQTAHTALASSLQNVLILIGLSRVVSPGVSAFCVFAAVAIIFDFFFLSTFFLSVLSVDVRRMELGDALAKAAQRQSHRRYGRGGMQGPATWSDSLFQGKIAWSTRIAGTIIMVGFVIIAQWHFFGDDHTSYHFLRYRNTNGTPRSSETAMLQGLHQARSHASWIRNQDHETAQEVIRLIKPTAYSYVAQVFEPLVFVKKHSDRIPHSKEPTLLPALYDFVHNQSSRFVLIVIIIVAALRLLMNYLLWGEDTELGNNDDQADFPAISIKSLGGGHALDVAMLGKSRMGHIVSVGLDRVVRVWDVRGSGRSYVVADGNDNEKCPFPVLSMAIDDTSTWLALLSVSRVSFWNLNKQIWAGSMPLETLNRRPAAFFFNHKTDLGRPAIVLVYHNGSLVELAAGDSIAGKATMICAEPIILARTLIRRKKTHSSLLLILVSKRGEVYVAEKGAFQWEARHLKLDARHAGRICQIETLSPLGLFALVGSDQVDLVDVDQRHVVWTLKTERMNPKSLQCAYAASTVPEADMKGLKSLTLCYAAAETGDCVVQAYVPTNDSDIMYFRSPERSTEGAMDGSGSMRELRKRIKNPGTWQVLSDGSVVGIRQVTLHEGAVHMASHGLRQRHMMERRNQNSFPHWEVWVTSACGKPIIEESQRLLDQDGMSSHLVVSALGPKVTVGLRSVAFAFGNVLKLVVTGGHERYDVGAEDKSYESLMNTTSRRRKGRDRLQS
ncbi:hypothetical protein E4U42_003754 [Claviceps africana]|uniref:SSD domain-containing protein n=1 Tax=Claviceps africana TaxID=83212 RepID=A0A8K0NIL3_9HYPO|nr:hypothetical protein E4U42_003754 [Claviceps africana]